MLPIIAIVPVRHYSQRVPGKNYRMLGEVPLYRYIIDTLLSIEQVSRVYVDTDSEIIKTGCEQLNNDRLIVLDRPSEMCLPSISMNKIILSVLDRIQNEINDETIVIQTHVTNPFLTRETILESLNVYQKEEPETLMTATKFQKRLWNSVGIPINHNPKQLLQTQDLNCLYEENSCMYIFKVKTIKQYENRLGEKIHFQLMDHLESWDIDTNDDFQMAEMIQIVNQSKQLKKSPIYPKINQELLDYLNTTLQPEITEFLSNLRSEITIQNQTPFRIMISAPYMMPDIDTFVHFYETLGCQVLVADVQERLTTDQLAKYHGQYDVALIGDDHYTDEVLKASKVKALCKWGTGIDSINQATCQELSIPIYNTPNAFTVPVTQSILAAIFGFIRQTFSSDHLMKQSDKWVKLQGKTLEEISIGIIGLGNIGKGLANALIPFNPKIYGTDIIPVDEINDLPVQVEYVNLNKLLEQSDIVCLCSTLNPTSYHLINSETLNQMKPGSYVINMARGPLINQIDLIAALENNHLAGVALDVFEHEPLERTSPLRFMPNAIISSHNANSSPKYWKHVHVNTIRNSFKALLNLL